MISSILAIAVKDLKLILRDKASAFFTFVFPLLLAIMFGFFFGGGGDSGHMTLGVVDEDRSEGARSFVQDLTEVDGIEVSELQTAGEAATKIRRGDLSAAVVLPKGFGESVSSVFSGGGMKITGYVAPGAKAETGLLTGKLTELGFRRMIDGFSDPKMFTGQIDRALASINTSPDISPERRSTLSTFLHSLGSFSKEIDAQDNAELKPPDRGGQAEGTGAKNGASDGPKNTGGVAERKSVMSNFRPVDVSFEELTSDRSGPRTAFEISFPQGVVWGLMGCTMAFGISLAEERTKGTLLRLTTSPLSRSQILLGKAVGCFIACVAVQTMLILMALLPPFRVHVTSPVAMVAGVLLCGLGFTGVMMLLAGLSRTESAAQGIGRAVMLVLALIGGGSMPLFLLPKVVQTISGISPFKWATLLIEGGLWRNFSAGDMLLPGGVMVVIGVAGYAIGASLFRWQE